jgi:hypothetical protein
MKKGAPQCYRGARLPVTWPIIQQKAWLAAAISPVLLLCDVGLPCKKRENVTASLYLYEDNAVCITRKGLF